MAFTNASSNGVKSGITNGKSNGHGAWVVLPHGQLEQLAENLWWTWGSVPRKPLRRSMVVARRRDGKLVVHNAVALDEAAMKELEALGKVGYIIVPSAAHRLDAPAFKRRFPKARVFTPRAARKAVEKVVEVDGIYEDFPPDPDVRLEMLHGVRDAEGAMIVRSSDGITVVLNDAVFDMDAKGGLLGFVFTKLLGSAPGPRVSRLAKLLFVRNKKALRDDLERYADHPDLVRLVVAHEKVARGREAARALRTAAACL